MGAAGFEPATSRVRTNEAQARATTYFLQIDRFS
jgi:hypothetical protein